MDCDITLRGAYCEKSCPGGYDNRDISAPGCAPPPPPGFDKFELLIKIDWF